jgi:hypothetical protein
MEHRGFQYRILQTASPTGFKWLVELPNGRTKSGTAVNRCSAVTRAVVTIEKVLKTRERMACEADDEGNKRPGGQNFRVI